jgi:mono/diheme cytochrome c family protein
MDFLAVREMRLPVLLDICATGLCVSVLLLGGCSDPATVPAAGRTADQGAAVAAPDGVVALTTVERGKQFADKNCSICHAVGTIGESPDASAPPFSTLHERYDVGDLGEAFAEGIIVPHEGGGRQMPEFMLEPQQIDDLIAYLRSLEVPVAAH